MTINTLNSVAVSTVSCSVKDVTDNNSKPIWNPKRPYKYLEDMEAGFQTYKRKAVSYYQSEFVSSDADRSVSVDELKDMIKKYFPQYKLTQREPKDPVTGIHYLYIDDTQLNKMASDPVYRAKVFGLMDSELQGTKGYTLTYSDGRNVTNYITGSIFSLAEANRSIDGVGRMPGSEGIPYHGSATGTGGFITSESHPQVRNQSFLNEHTRHQKSSGKGHTSVTQELLKRLAKKRTERIRNTKEQIKEAELARLDEKLEYREDIEKTMWAGNISADETEPGIAAASVNYASSGMEIGTDTVGDSFNASA